MIQLFNRLFEYQYIRFLVVGGTSAAVAFVSRYFLDMFMDFKTAVAISYLFGMLVAFILNKKFVFDANGSNLNQQINRFVQVNLFGMALVWLVSVTLARYVFPALSFTWYADDIAHLIGLACPMISSYFGYRYYTFKQSA